MCYVQSIVKYTVHDVLRVMDCAPCMMYNVVCAMLSVSSIIWEVQWAMFNVLCAIYYVKRIALQA